MKVLLVAVNNEHFPYPVPPLGASYIGQAVASAGHELTFLDLCFAPGEGAAELEAAITDLEPQVVAFSIRNIDNVSLIQQTHYLPRILRLIQLCGQLSPAPRILGGSGFSIMPQLILQLSGAQWGVVGPGEGSILSFLDALAQNQPMTQVPGLCWIEGETWHQNPKTAAAFDQPAGYGLIDLEQYEARRGLVNVLTKRGCPFKCSYCTYPAISGTATSTRPTASVVRDLAALKERGLKGPVFFVDDVFNHPTHQAAELAQALIKARLDIGWYAFASPRGFDQRLAELFRESGCLGLEFGTDAAHPKTLAGLQKDFSPQDIRRSIEACNQAGLPAAHYLIFMGPDEDEESFEATLELFEQHRPTAAIAFLGPRIFPNTQLAQRALADGLIDRTDDLREPRFYLSPKIGQEPVRARLQQLAQGDSFWQVPGLGPAPNQALLNQLFERGYRGPAWDLLDPQVVRRVSLMGRKRR
ncbi:MAG: lipid biosynthesis B12-binding/radical SAM protein [bacterium]|nr:lipid biosynthesis B12-binding/radical SAM protein [bacterium]